MESFRSLRGRQQPLVLALLPLDPGGVVHPGQPAVDGRTELGLAAQTDGEGEVADAEAETRPDLGEGAKLVQLAQAVPAVAAGAARGDDEAGLLEIAEHARRPARAGGGVADVERVHRQNPNTVVSRLAGSNAGGGAGDAVEPALGDGLLRRCAPRRELLLPDVAARAGG